MHLFFEYGVFHKNEKCYQIFNGYIFFSFSFFLLKCPPDQATHLGMIENSTSSPE